VIHLFGRVVAPVASLAPVDKGPFDGAVVEQMLVSRLCQITKRLPRVVAGRNMKGVLGLLGHLLLMPPFVLDSCHIVLVD
jgi:hypothetical protein